jgi:hypothetical protein
MDELTIEEQKELRTAVTWFRAQGQRRERILRDAVTKQRARAERAARPARRGRKS